MSTNRAPRAMRGACGTSWIMRGRARCHGQVPVPSAHLAPSSSLSSDGEHSRSARNWRSSPLARGFLTTLVVGGEQDVPAPRGRSGPRALPHHRRPGSGSCGTAVADHEIHPDRPDAGLTVVVATADSGAPSSSTRYARV